MISPSGKKTNHKKGIAAQAKERKRLEAEARNEKFQALPLAQKLIGQSHRVRAKYQVSE